MANAPTRIAFDIPATRADAECFIKVIEAATAIADGEQPLLAPEIEAAFRSRLRTSVLVELLDGQAFGIECRFDAIGQSLHIFDSAGSPNLWALAQCLQRLYPDKLPIGFAYSIDGTAQSPGGVGGGLFAIGTGIIVDRTLDQMLATELGKLLEMSGGN